MKIYAHRCKKCSTLLEIPTEAIRPDNSYQPGFCRFCGNPMAGGVAPGLLLPHDEAAHS
jgi:hypothetical protein